MNLYQKYRPQSFDEMVGNEAQIASLKKVLAKKDKSHAFLFTGPSGCGKTTAARIAARELGAGEMSIQEINSADNRGIDTARHILDLMRYSPTDGEAMVFIIDELHMTTKDWQNAMLKPLEDTPEHVYFFLCTTEPQKLAVALKNRCIEIKFAPLKPEQITLLLRTVNKGESLGVTKDILLDIADACDGSPRKALVMLEKVAALDDPKEQQEVIAAGGAEEDEAEAIELCRVLMGKCTWGQVMEIVARLKKEDLENTRQVVMGYMKAILRKTWNAKAAMILDAFTQRDFFYDPESRLFVALAQIFCPE
jgi:DNA polymerase-3 subunit gamma/tau